MIIITEDIALKQIVCFFFGNLAVDFIGICAAIENEDICRNGNDGIGKPEPLLGNLSGFWSRRINDKDRLVYKIDSDNVYILACRYHYSDK